MPSRRRVLLIGLDAGTFDVINPLFEAKQLPVLQGLTERGVSAVMESTIPPITPPAWTSIVTGKNPGKHGLFDFVIRKPGTYEESLATSQNRKCDAIWNILTSAGLQVIVVNVPMTYPPEKVAGCMISGIGSPDVSPRIAYPSTILQDIESNCGPYRVMYDAQPTEGNCDEFVADLKRLTRTRGQTVRYLMKRIDWDFLMVVFQSTDWVQHFFWRFMDKSHSLYNSRASECQRTAIASIYKAIDEEVGLILAETSVNDYVFVVSDHGMGPLIKDIYLNNWLAKEGYLRYKRNLKYLAHRLGVTSENAYKIAMRLSGARAVSKLRTKKETVLFHLFLSLQDVDWSKTKAYSIGLDGNVRINVKGREPEGIVQSGEEYNRLIEELRTKLESLSDPDSGAKVTDGVFSRDQIFTGPSADESSDLVLVLTRYHQDYRFGSNSILGPPPDKTSGNHRRSGIFVATGPNIKSGVRVSSRDLLDITPTILQILKILPPHDSDGKPMTDIFSTSIQNELESKKPTGNLTPS